MIRAARGIHGWNFSFLARSTDSEWHARVYAHSSFVIRRRAREESPCGYARARARARDDPYIFGWNHYTTKDAVCVIVKIKLDASCDIANKYL